MELLRDLRILTAGAELPTISQRLVRKGRQKDLRNPGPFQAKVYLIQINDRTAVVKDYNDQFPLFRLLVSRQLVRRELQAYRKLDGCPGTPRLLAQLDGYGLILEYIPGKLLSKTDPQQLSPEIFDRLRDLLREMHRRGIVHRDIRRKNILITPAGQPILIDFNTALAKGPCYRLINQWFFRIFREIDHQTLLKIKDSFYPGLLTLDERARLNRPLPLLRLGRFLRRRVFRKLKRRLQGKR